jgi:hypothetical protein
MSQQAQQRQFDARFYQPVGLRRYEQRQREVKSGLGRSSEWAHPLEFDESGFPIPQRRPGFVERVARLLAPW